MENKYFVLERFGNEFGVKHIGCHVFGSDWNTKSMPHLEYKHCCGCNVEIPKYILLQLELLNGK